MRFQINGQKLDTWQVTKALVAEDRLNGEQLSPFATIKMYRKLKAIVPKGAAWDLKNLDNLKKVKTESSVLSVEEQESQNQEVLNNLKTSVRTEEDDLYLRAIAMNERGVFVPQGKKGKMLFSESKLVASLKADKTEENREKSKLLGAIDHCKKNCKEHKQTIEGCNTELQRISERLSNLQEKCKKAGIDTSQVTVGRYKLCDLQEKLKELQENAEQILGQCNKVIGESESIMNGGSSILRLISDPSRKEKIPPKEVMPDQNFEYVDDNSAALTEIASRNGEIIRNSHQIEQDSVKLIGNLFLLDEAVEQVENTSEEQLKNVQIQQQRMKAQANIQENFKKLDVYSKQCGSLMWNLNEAKNCINKIGPESSELQNLYDQVTESIQKQKSDISKLRSTIDHTNVDEQSGGISDDNLRTVEQIPETIAKLQEQVDQFELKGLQHKTLSYQNKLENCEQQCTELEGVLKDFPSVDGIDNMKRHRELSRQLTAIRKDISSAKLGLKETENEILKVAGAATNRKDRHNLVQAWREGEASPLEPNDASKEIDIRIMSFRQEVAVFEKEIQNEAASKQQIGAEKLNVAERKENLVPSFVHSPKQIDDPVLVEQQKTLDYFQQFFMQRSENENGNHTP